jgi:dihydrofolate reductase
MKLTGLIFLSLDGVYQGPGAPDEDRRGGFERGGWQANYFDEESGQFITTSYERADALLLGRVTWEIWESYWPRHDDHPIGHIINSLPKYVPSTTRNETSWQNTHFIERDLEARVRELKQQPGRDLLVQGSGALLHWLLDHDLVDELRLMTSPVVVGDGLRLFRQPGQTHNLSLIEAQATPIGNVIQTYRPAGRATFGTVGEE